MTPAARLQATLELLSEIDRTPRPADALVSAYFRARRYIGSKDRAAISTAVYDILRHHARLGWWFEKESGQDLTDAFSPRLRLLAYLILVERQSPKDIATSFSGGKYAPASLEDGEKKLLPKLEGHTAEHPSMPEDVKAECPGWAAATL